jgi:hypothetical protein
MSIRHRAQRPIAPSIPQKRSSEYANAPHGDIANRSFRVIHPYHPLFQQEFELVSCRQNWGEDRVWFHDRSYVNEAGKIESQSGLI